jgi:hypothetical protein
MVDSVIGKQLAEADVLGNLKQGSILNIWTAVIHVAKTGIAPSAKSESQHS